MKTFDNESFILDTYRLVSSNDIIYNGRFCHCNKIKKITKAIKFSKFWIDSSSKNDLPPDFHNERQKIMMEFMRVDDCVNVIEEGKVINSFERTNHFLKKLFGDDYKKQQNGLIYFLPDTRDSNNFNFNGYIDNFEKIIMKHSDKIDNYKKNYPNCKKVIFFVCDESNNYIQVFNKEDLKKEDDYNVNLKFLIHHWYLDKKFIDIIKKCGADYLIWFGIYKSIFVNGRKIKCPKVCIFDINNIKNDGIIYNHDLMFKVKREEINN